MRDEVLYTPQGIPPWHMWGNTQMLDVKDVGGVKRMSTGGQLIKIAHHRPDTWQWLFQAKLIEGPTLDDDSDNMSASLHVYWDVTTGLGRSAVQLIGFDAWRWGWSRGNGDIAAPVGHVMWATSTQTPGLDFETVVGGTGTSIPSEASRRTISQIVGQDIQVNVRSELYVNGLVDGEVKTAKIEVSAYMTPNCGAPELQQRPY